MKLTSPVKRRHSRIEIIPERFPVKSRLHGGLKGALFNSLFVNAFNALPRRKFAGRCEFIISAPARIAVSSAG